MSKILLFISKFTAALLVLLSYTAAAKEPPADLGYDPPQGWEFVMKLDSASRFYMYAYNDTCYLEFYVPYKEYHLLSYDGGNTWNNVEKSLIDPYNPDSELFAIYEQKFMINSTKMQRIVWDKRDSNIYYEKSYDFFKTVAESYFVAPKTLYKPDTLYESPIDTSLLIINFSYRIAQDMIDLETNTPFISRDAGRTWSVPPKIWHLDYTIFKFYFDWAEKGHWFATITDGDNSYWHINKDTYWYNETWDDGLTFDINYMYLNPISPYIGIDGKFKTRDWLTLIDSNYNKINPYGIVIGDYADSIIKYTEYDWLYIMDPTKPKTNKDSGYVRSLETRSFHFSNYNYNNEFIPNFEIIGDIKNFKYKYKDYLYNTINYGKNWQLLNFLNAKPLLFQTFLDQNKKVLWIRILDEEFTAYKRESEYKGSLWKLKLPWESTNIENYNSADSIVIYPNPARDKIKIYLPKSDREYSIKFFGILGTEVYKLNNISLSEQNFMEIKLSENFSSGTYIVSARAGEKVFITKLIVIK